MKVLLEQSDGEKGSPKHNPVAKMKNQGQGDPNSKEGTKFLPENRQENEITSPQLEL